jgi:hypothetical protein
MAFAVSLQTRPQPSSIKAAAVKTLKVDPGSYTIATALLRQFSAPCARRALGSKKG